MCGLACGSDLKCERVHITSDAGWDSLMEAERRKKKRKSERSRSAAHWRADALLRLLG